MPKNTINTFSQQEINKLLIAIKGPIAVADSLMAPFGFATKEYLKNSFADQKVKPKNFIYGRNIEQTTTFIYTNAAQCGFISLSSIIGKVNKKEYWIVPNNLYPPIIQKAAIIKQSKQILHSKNFIHFFTTSENVKNIIIYSGYALDLNKI